MDLQEHFLVLVKMLGGGNSSNGHSKTIDQKNFGSGLDTVRKFCIEMSCRI